MIHKLIVLVSAVGCLWLFSTAGIWGAWVDSVECSAPKVAKRVQL